MLRKIFWNTLTGSFYKEMMVFRVDNSLSAKFANMGFLFALVVVFIHVPSVPNGGVSFLKNVFPGFLQGTANAWFFLAAGFFFAGHVGESHWWRDSVIKRLSSLLVPYLVLNLIMLLLLMGYQRSGFCFPVNAKSSPVWQSMLRAMGIWSCSPIDGPTWFIRSLLFYVMTTPVVFPLLMRIRVAIPFLMCLFVLNIFGWENLSVGLGSNNVWMAFCKLYTPDELFYFLSGVMFRLHKIPEISIKPAVVALLIGALCSIYAPMNAMPINNQFLYDVAYNLSKPLIIVGVFGLMPSRNLPKILTRNSFAIYILHWQLITASYIVCGKIGTHEVVFGNPIWLLLYWLVVVVITILVASCIRKVRALEMLMLGGR